MLYLICSIFCSVLVAVLLKIARNNNKEIFVMVHTNYLVAIISCLCLFNANFYKTNTYGDTLYLCIFLGVLLPVLFMVLSKSIAKTGIIKTDIAQRFSLIIPILVSVFFWNQEISLHKGTGLFLGFLALGLILYKKQPLNFKSYWPLLVLIGYGLVDVLFKKLALVNYITYTDCLLLIFTIAFLSSCLVGIYLYTNKKITYNKSSIIYGGVLGLLNFVNIFTYIKAHKIVKDNPAVVFATMNFGVIVLSTIVGYFYFKENINKYNTIGIILSLIAIALITLF